MCYLKLLPIETILTVSAHLKGTCLKVWFVFLVRFFLFLFFCTVMNEILPIKYIIGSWFLRVIKVCVCVL